MKLNIYNYKIYFFEQNDSKDIFLNCLKFEGNFLINSY